MIKLILAIIVALALVGVLLFALRDFVKSKNFLKYTGLTLLISTITIALLGFIVMVF